MECVKDRDVFILASFAFSSVHMSSLHVGILGFFSKVQLIISVWVVKHYLKLQFNKKASIQEALTPDQKEVSGTYVYI